MKKKEITLQDILNEMGSMYSTLWNRIEDIRCELVHIQELIDPAEDAQPDNKKYSEPEIPNTAYVTLTEEGCFVGGKPATQYNGKDIYRPYMCVAYFKEARDIIREEKNVELLEIHALQSSTDGSYAEVGNPVPDSNGTCEWVRIKFKDTNGNILSSRWVFSVDYGSASNCASDCTRDCGDYVRSNGSLRAGLFGSVASN